jgi:hypothetical protein
MRQTGSGGGGFIQWTTATGYSTMDRLLAAGYGSSGGPSQCPYDGAVGLYGLGGGGGGAFATGTTSVAAGRGTDGGGNSGVFAGSAGSNGTANTGGGGGGGVANATTGYAGGNGADGVVYITWWE